MTPKEKAKQLVDEFNGLADECDCLEYMCVCSRISESLAKQVAEICISKQFELLRYLGSKTSEELYNDLVEQKQALKDKNLHIKIPFYSLQSKAGKKP